MDTPAPLSRDDVVARLKDWLEDAVLSKDDLSVIPRTSWDRARVLLEQLHRSEGTTPDRAAAAARVAVANIEAEAHPRELEELDVDDVTTMDGARAFLRSLSIPLALTAIAQRQYVPAALVPPDLLRSYLATGPVPWPVFGSFNNGGPSEDIILEAMESVLQDATRLEVTEVMDVLLEWVKAGRVPLMSPVGRLLVEYARGARPAQVPTQQYRAAQCVAQAVSAPSDILATAARLAGPLDHGVVLTVVHHANATPEVWAAAADCVVGDRVTESLTKIPEACRVEAVWKRALASVEPVLSDTNRYGQRHLKLRAEAVDRLGRLLRSTDEDGIAPVLAALTALDEGRAYHVVSRMGKRRLQSLAPEALLPLMGATSSTIRSGMVTLLSAVGPQATPSPTRGRPRG